MIFFLQMLVSDRELTVSTVCADYWDQTTLRNQHSRGNKRPTATVSKATPHKEQLLRDGSGAHNGFPERLDTMLT